MSSPNLTLANTRVILVRHGQSTFNAQGRYQGRSDQAILTQKGRDGAYQTGVALQQVFFDAIYTSPLQRTVETTNEIVKAIYPQLPPIYTDNNLLEIALPAWQGKTFADVRQNFASDDQCWQQRPHDQMNSIETKCDRHNNATIALAHPVLNLYAQARQFWSCIIPRHAGKTILVVSHGGTNRALISTTLNLSPDRYHAIQQSNCGISILEFPANQSSAQLIALNLTNHLDEILPKLKAGKHGLRLLLLPIDAIATPQVQHLAFLQSVKIDFSLTDASECAEEMSASILKNCPTTIQLHVSRHDFTLAKWQQSIALCRSHIAHTLVTGLAIASSSIIKCILGQTLGLNPNDFWRLQLKSSNLSVVHYPFTDTPVSQAINLSHTNQIQSSQEQFL